MRGASPIHEPGLDAVVKRNGGRRLQFTTDVDAAVQHGTLLFIGVGTPPDEDGSADLQYVVAAARSIGARMKEFKVIVDRARCRWARPTRCAPPIAEELAKRGVNIGLRRWSRTPSS